MRRGMRLALLLTLAAGACATPTLALADDVVADDIARDTPISARDGVVAWSHFDAAAQRYRLVLRRGGRHMQAKIAGSRKPFDVSLGTDRRGRTVALYTRCRRAGERGCDVYRYDLATRTEERIDAVSAPDEDEAWPAQSGDVLAFVRRRRSGGRGLVRDCDVPFARRLSSPAPSRRLDRGACARTTALSLRGSRIVQVTVGSPPAQTYYISRVRRLSARGGHGRVLARSASRSGLFGSPSQSAKAVWLSRRGFGVASAFVRIDLATDKLSEVPTHATVTGAVARDERGAWWYVTASRFVERDCSGPAPTPCRLIRASPDPFSGVERRLAPTMRISLSVGPGPVVFGVPVTVSGELARPVVRRGAFVRAEPVANATVRLLRGRLPVTPRREAYTYTSTSLTAATGTDGRWSIALPVPPAQLFFSAVTEGLPERTFAIRGTAAGGVHAAITLAVAGNSFSGTVAPAQPGRSVRIQIRTKRTCSTGPPNAPTSCEDEYATVARAPLDAAGTAFVAASARIVPGVYTAALPVADQRADPDAYSGRSPEVVVGG